MQFVFDEKSAAKYLVLIRMLMIEQVFICFGSITKMLLVFVWQRTKKNNVDNTKIDSWKRLSASGKNEKAVAAGSLTM